MKNPQTKNCKLKINKGFTLIELAIVLVIIGVITGGVLAGQELIRASEISSVAAQMTKYQSAYNKYKDQYRAVPGDHSKAWDYWGTDCMPTEAACNGDGNRRIEAISTEAMRFFRHLWLAELIDEELTGIYTTPNIIGSNVPTTEITGLTFLAFSVEKIDFFISGQNYTSTEGVKATILSLGRITSTWPVNSPLTPEDAKKIDIKLDDGKPGTGSIIAGRSLGTPTSGCTNNSSNTLSGMRSSKYRVSVDSLLCKLGLILEEPV